MDTAGSLLDENGVEFVDSYDPEVVVWPSDVTADYAVVSKQEHDAKTEELNLEYFSSYSSSTTVAPGAVTDSASAHPTSTTGVIESEYDSSNLESLLSSSNATDIKLSESVCTDGGERETDSRTIRDTDFVSEPFYSVLDLRENAYAIVAEEELSLYEMIFRVDDKYDSLNSTDRGAPNELEGCAGERHSERVHTINIGDYVVRGWSRDFEFFKCR